MEHHHLHGCVNYETKKPNAPRKRKRLTSDLGLDSTSRAISITTSTAAASTNYTSNSNTNSKREDAKSEPPPIQTQPPTTPPSGAPDPNPQHSTNTTNQAAEGQTVGVQLPLQGGYALTHQYTPASLRQMIAQQNTFDVDELGSTFFRDTKQTSQLIYGFKVFQDYRAALKSQNRTAIHTVDENGNHLKKYCGICYTWLQIDLTTNDTPLCEVCAIQSALLDDANRNVSSPANNKTENTRTQPHSPQTTTMHTAAPTPNVYTTASNPATSTAATASFVKKVEKLSNTNIHEAKQTNEESTIIIADAIEEIEYTYTRMRSYEFRAERDNFVDESATKFDLDLIKLLTAEEKDRISNEMKDEIRRKSWRNEARAQLALHEGHQGMPYHQTQEEMFEIFVQEEQTRNRERADAIRPKHLPTHVQQLAAQNFCVYYTRLSPSE
jgi:hypothetical protein